MNACIRSGVLSRSFWASSGLASLPLRGSCACGARLRLRRSRCHCVAADGGVSPPPRRAGRPFPHGLPAPTGGPQRSPPLMYGCISAGLWGRHNVPSMAHSGFRQRPVASTPSPGWPCVVWRCGGGDRGGGSEPRAAGVLLDFCTDAV